MLNQVLALSFTPIKFVNMYCIADTEILGTLYMHNSTACQTYLNNLVYK